MGLGSASTLQYVLMLEAYIDLLPYCHTQYATLLTEDIVDRQVKLSSSADPEFWSWGLDSKSGQKGNKGAGFNCCPQRHVPIKTHDAEQKRGLGIMGTPVC